MHAEIIGSPQSAGKEHVAWPGTSKPAGKAGETEEGAHSRCRSDGVGSAAKTHVVQRLRLEALRGGLSSTMLKRRAAERARLEELERLKKEGRPPSRPKVRELTTKTTVSAEPSKERPKQVKSEKKVSDLKAPPVVDPPKKPGEEEKKVTRPLCISGKEGNLDGYIIGRLIGQGAYATVRLAYHKKLGKKSALKVYDKKKLVEPQRQKSVYREIRLLEKMSHPNIVRLYDAFDTENHVILAMEYVRGHSLHSYLKAQPSRMLEEWEAKRLFKQVVCGIEYCHSKSIAHRDIKLENLLLDEHNNVKIIDFGFSTCIPNTRKIKIFCGTPSYMSPEIVLRKEYAGPPADVWALGVLLYAMLCGTFPFKGRNDKELYRRISACQLVFPDHLSLLARSLLQSIFKVDPDKRPAAAEIAKDDWLSEQEQEQPFQKVPKETPTGSERQGINVEAYMAYYNDQTYLARTEGPELLARGVRMVTNNVAVCGTVNNNINIINNITHINFPPQNGSINNYSSQSFSSKGSSFMAKSNNNSNVVFGSESSKTGGSVVDNDLLSSIMKLGYSIDDIKQQLQNENSHIYKLYNKLLGERKQQNAGVAPQVVPSITSSFEAFKSKSRLGMPTRITPR